MWPDFHEALASEVRPEVGIIDDEGMVCRIVPDVAVVRTSRDETFVPDAALLTERRSRVSESVDVMVSSVLLRHQFVELCDASRGHRRAYLRKQGDVLESDISVERGVFSLGAACKRRPVYWIP